MRGPEPRHHAAFHPDRKQQQSCPPPASDFCLYFPSRDCTLAMPERGLPPSLSRRTLAATLPQGTERHAIGCRARRRRGIKLPARRGTGGTAPPRTDGKQRWQHGKPGRRSTGRGTGSLESPACGEEAGGGSRWTRTGGRLPAKPGVRIASLALRWLLCAGRRCCNAARRRPPRPVALPPWSARTSAPASASRPTRLSSLRARPPPGAAAVSAPGAA